MSLTFIKGVLTTVGILRNLLIIIFLSPVASIGNSQLTTIGWIESVRVIPEGLTVMAKIDTGADNSSVDVLEWDNFEREGNQWIRFKIRNNENEEVTLERPHERFARIKRKQSEPLKRPVVNMWLCLGNEKIMTQVNLSKRKNFKFRMLIGRSLLKGRYLVDSARQNTLKPECGS